MLTGRKLLNCFLGLGLFLSIVTSPADAVQGPEPTSGQRPQFHRIEQPQPLKMSVTLGGFALIGLELWWFQFSQTKAQQAKIR